MSAAMCRRTRLAFLLAGTAAIVLSAGQPVHAIVINDQTAEAAGGIGSYFDSTNVYSNVGLINPNDCTGTLINSRTVLTAAHCFIGQLPTTGQQDQYMGGAQSVSFGPTEANPNPRSIVSTTILNQGFRPFANNSVAIDIALISLATPITNITPATLLTAKPGSPGFPPTNAVLALVGYGNFGTGSQPPTADGRPTTTVESRIRSWAATSRSER